MMKRCTRAAALRGAGLILLAVLASTSALEPASAQVFEADQPIWTDPDRLDMPAPEPHDIGDFYDFWVNTFAGPGAYDGPALNTNSLGDVPASSWYTPRHFWKPMSIEALRRGPNRRSGPSEQEPWEVVAAKTEGKSPGLEVVDARGDRYVLKLDPPGHLELTSGAEVVSTKILYALGYNVPENFPVRFARKMLVPGEDATMETPEGEAPITQLAIDSVLADAPQYADGTYRGLASLFLEGEPIGPFLYYGTRPDDGNDIFPHEGRRELRGLRTIAAWINHTDARSINSLDMVVEEDGRQYVRHNLIDFGSTLGAGPLGPKRRWDGYEYILDGASIFTRLATLGAAGLEWAAIDYPAIPAVGHIDADHFDPDEWRTQYPNAAFIRADEADKFWAAKQIANLTDEEIRAIVETADYSDEAAERYIADVLIERRNKIARAYLRYGGGLDRFELRHGVLAFDDLPARHGLVDGSRWRHVIWRSFDNETGRAGEIIVADQVEGTRLTVPRSDEEFLVGEIRTPNGGITRVYLRSAAGRREIVGVERMSR